MSSINIVFTSETEPGEPVTISLPMDSTSDPLVNLIWQGCAV